MFTSVLALLIAGDLVHVDRITQPALSLPKGTAGPEAQAIYRQRAATSETINADLRCFRGLVQLTVRGLDKALSVVLWSALAYNLMHFGRRCCGE